MDSVAGSGSYALLELLLAPSGSNITHCHLVGRFMQIFAHYFFFFFEGGVGGEVEDLFTTWYL